MSDDLPTVPVAYQKVEERPTETSKHSAPKRVEGGVLSRPRGTVATVIMALLSLLWLFPLIWAVINSFRDYNYTQQNGYLSFGGWTISNYKEAWDRGQFGLHFWNSLIITVPAVLLTLFLASLVAFVLARFSFKFNLAMLGFFLAANLLPPQALLIPVFKMFQQIHVPYWMSDSGTMLNNFWGLILVNVAFQLGFCTFVLSNYMKTIPMEIYESAELDGASVFRQYWQMTMPLVRPALAALATLEVTWIYNEFFWATVLLQRSDKFPITSALNNLRGQFFTDTNLVAAGSVLVAMPVLIVFFVLQKQFVSGLTLGSTKG
ncbi:MAG: carbohydrate ABC transporter permease [Nocardioidaceae bacterium]|nr:carbohydrate ABC transporter permease [Nocardioidaceae bacterium]